MSRGYLKYNEYATAFKLLKPYIDTSVLDKLSMDTDAAKYFNISARLARFFSEDHLRAIEQLQQSIPPKYKASVPNSFWEGLPLMSLIAGEEPKLRVFPNIKIDDCDPFSIRHVSFFTPYEVLASFKKDYEETKNTPAWKDTRRVLTRVKKNDYVNITKFLARYTAAPKHLPDHVIRDWAVTFEENLKPAKIIWGEKPEDYLEMYGSGGPSSCMRTSGEQSRDWNFMVKELNIHPTSFYAYHPYTKGAYIKRNDTVVARVITFDFKNATEIAPKINGTLFYGRIYGANPVYITQLKSALESLGYKPLKINLNTACEFSIPGIKHNSDYICPVPYFDNHIHNKGLYISFDKEKSLFNITSKSGSGMLLHTGGTRGFVKGGDCRCVGCSYCNSTVQHTQRQFRSRVGEGVYCSSKCYTSAGLSLIYTADGSQYVEPYNAAEHIKVEGESRCFSTLMAALRAEVRPLLSSVDEAIEYFKGKYEHTPGKRYCSSSSSNYSICVDRAIRINRNKIYGHNAADYIDYCYIEGGWLNFKSDFYEIKKDNDSYSHRLVLMPKNKGA